MRDQSFEAHCWAEVDLDAILYNFRLLRQRVGDTPICAVVKADAYGHGDCMVARTLAEAGAKWFAVSCLEEALHLRRAGLGEPILVLGMTQPSHAKELADNRVTQTLLSLEYAQALAASAKAAGVTVEGHLKVDTGMGRIGFQAQQELSHDLSGLRACCQLEGLRVTGIFQHFAVADSMEESDRAYTERQYDLFRQVVEQTRAVAPQLTVHCCNSAGLLLHPEWGGDLVRAGIALYGQKPSEEDCFDGLHPAMTLKTVVSHVKTVETGMSVGYGRAFTAERPTRVATLCCGYADGYPRLMSGQGVVDIHGQAARVLGRVAMDQMMVDVTDIPEVTMGDEAVVLGEGAGDSFATAAQKVGTIPYELLCGIARRVPRLYRRGGGTVAVLNYLEE